MQRPKNSHIHHRESLSKTQRMAVWVTSKIGTMGFLYCILTWTAIWLMWNTFAPAGLRFDPFPAFVVWLFLSNLVQLSLLPLVLIAQQIDANRQQMKAELDHEMLTQDVEASEEILDHLRHIHSDVEEIKGKITK
jgi:uncharacterized membrane protein